MVDAIVHRFRPNDFALVFLYHRTAESTYSHRNAALPARVHGPLSKPILRCVSIRFQSQSVRPSVKRDCESHKT